MDWYPLVVIPGIRLSSPVETKNVQVLDSASPLAETLRVRHKNFDQFLLRFSGQFGEPISPAIVFVRQGAKTKFRQAHMTASLLHILAMSTIPFARANFRLARFAIGPIFSDSFHGYPWMIDLQSGLFSAQVPDFCAIHNVKKFYGQSNPSVARTEVGNGQFDLRLRNILFYLWQKYSGIQSRNWFATRVFRSLSFADIALSAPGGREVTLLDYGRSLCMWVSAFETLVHKGTNEKSGFRQVMEMLKACPMGEPMREPRYYKNFAKKQISDNVTFVQSLYSRIYSLRNDFLHGNPMPFDKRLGGTSILQLCDAAPTMYRFALLHVLKTELGDICGFEEKYDFFVRRQLEESLEILKPSRTIPPPSS